MFYCKGKIRYPNLSSLLKKSGHQLRFNYSLPHTNINDDNIEAVGRQLDDQQINYANKVISIIKTPDEVKNELQGFVHADFTNFKELTAPGVSNQKILSRNVEYKSINKLNEILSDNQVKKALELVKSNYKQGNFLTFVEFQNLFIQFLPFNWYAYRLLKLYETKYDLTSVHTKVLALVLKISYANFDFKLFDRSFQSFQTKSDKIPVDILMSAIQVYLKTENIQIATQLFNQQVMTEEDLPPRILDLFISNLYNQTRNINLCFSSYRLWLSKKLDTNISIDSFMYNLLLESGNTEDISWIEKSLKDRNRYDKFVIRFGNLCNDLSKNYNSYNTFINSEELLKFKILAERDNEVTSLLNNLTYLHLRHRNYELALETFKQVDNRKDFQLTIFSILRHFEKEQKPEMIYSVLKNLKEQSNYRIHWSQILIYWRSVIKKYPHLGFELQKKFKKSLKRSKYHRFGFLSKMLLVNKQSSNGATLEIRYYPIVKYDNLEFDIKPLPAAPKLQNIESRLVAGILPNSELLRKSVKLTNDKFEFDRLVEIANQLQLRTSKNTAQVKNIKLNVEIFYKECSFGTKLSMKEFINEQLNIIDDTKFVDDQDLCELFKVCVKSEFYEESVFVLSLLEEYKVKIVGDQQILKFLSMFIKWCWINKDFKDLLTILEWLKNQTEFTTDKYFWSNLKNAASKNVSRIEREFCDISHSSFTQDQIVALGEEKTYIEKVLPHVMNYYDYTLDKIKDKNLERSDLVIDHSFRCFSQMIKWVDEDTETMFEGEW
ncbi:hypothetical protein PICMEDRAFT_73564 [Pichia membranifaciens NRRL Y-2026]|uniref:Mitochondrial group I intron splicing factor CCM1 n=1 Tax=Pichia membranifaciens NRRL Y-2026 TaxID=763406 RepID=A0A1E3NIX5_9ASCO|nr:hypothetical protein PICMEDRAFT_73564 [Pichia membranifaciens NRRL Y-2026]ODQ46089.1 hypothetical protein PICMEDRAFT_73564 [Pichia membranifaciens NRRL Y-2026]